MSKNRSCALQGWRKQAVPFETQGRAKIGLVPIPDTYDVACFRRLPMAKPPKPKRARDRQ